MEFQQLPHPLLNLAIMKNFIRLSLLFVCIFLFHSNAFSQKYTVNDFYKIDSLANAAQPKNALALINKINNQARAEGNTTLLIKSVIYRMLFQSYLEEDAFTKILTDLKQDIGSAKQPEKSVLQSLLAETYWKYYQQNMYRISNRTNVQGNIGDDIKTWSNQKLTEEITVTFLASLAQADLLQNVKMGALNDILIGDKQNRILRPTLYDLLAHRAIDVFAYNQMGITPLDNGTVEVVYPLGFTDSHTFLAIAIPQSDSSSTYLKTLGIFRNLLKFHTEHKNLAALADADLKRLKFIYQNSTSVDKHKEFYKALESLANQIKNTEIYADVLYEQAVLIRNAQLQVDTSNLNLVKAVDIANRAINAYPTSIGSQNSKNLIQQIKRQELSIQVKETIIPDRPAQIRFTYKNLDTLYLKLYQKPTTSNRYFELNDKQQYLNFLKNNKLLREWMIILPQSIDHQTHTLIDKIDKLPAGSYVIFVQGSKDNPTESTLNYANFKASNLAITNRLSKNGTHEYFVKDSRTGYPLKNVVIHQKGTKYYAGRNENINGVSLKTDEFGYAETNEITNIQKALVIHERDSTYIDIENYKYDENEIRKRVILFTDRPIYRPGQTIYYKGLYIINEHDKNSILIAQTMHIGLYDTNGGKIEETKVTTNEFGTFQGSFTIPTGKLNGSMRLHTDFGSILVQVEEYKRPTFEVKFDKLNQKYKLNDSIKLQGAAQTFSGYAVSGAKVKYTVFQRVITNYRFDRYAYQNPKQIAIGSTTTKADGKFELGFFAKSNQPQENYTFDIKVEITDLNGETRTNTQSLNVGKKDITLDLPLPGQLFLKEKTDSLSFLILNLNNERIKANLKVEWQLLKAPERLTTKSPFYAEKYSLSREDFIKNFPNDDYDNESEPTKWQVKRLQFKQDLQVADGKGKLNLNSKDLPAGYYKAKFMAINTLNDTITLEKIVRIYGAEAVSIQNNAEWLVTEKNVITPGESAIFRIAGLAPNTKAYYEVYYRNQVSKKVWLTLSDKQEIIQIKPESNFKNDFAVQFTMVYNGNIYNSIQKVNIVDASKQLEIKFLTFRNKLQPGEKESWKLQISNKQGEKQIAELLATLYDASLDDLKKMDWESNIQTAYNYDSYNWRLNLFNLANGRNLWFLRINNQGYFAQLNRTYETLNLFGFNYYGGYNSGYRDYLNMIQNVKKQGLSEEAIKKLAELKKGRTVHGLIMDNMGLIIPGATIKVGKTTTTSDQYGVYSINAKVGDQVQVILIGYEVRTIIVGQNKRLDIKLFSENNSLAEVVVTGFGNNNKNDMQRSMAGAIATIRSDTQAKEFVAPPYSVTEESVVYTFASMEGYDEKSKTYLINGKPVTMPKAVEVRSNFNETAFFYPQLQTNEKGEITIEFTIPQSLTRYKMMGFAHTKDLKTTTVTNELITQKQLAISANAPRFFREGDTILFSAKLNNVSGSKLKGEVLLELRDALTGKLIKILAPNAKSELSFEITNSGNEALKWPLIIPSGVGAISYKLIAQSGKYSDGEEMTIPVLPNSMLVTESMPLNVRGNTTSTFNMEKLSKSGNSKTLRNQSLTFEFTSNPIWYAIQALPYLIEYPYECAEQTFSRFYANSFAKGIINSSPRIKQVFDQWKQMDNGNALLSNLEKNQELKSILLEETPWIRNANNETERKKRLAVLFDLNRMTYELKNNFEKLEQMQNANGSFSWFSGMNEDRYITQHIVLGMGQLKKLKLIDEKAYPNFDRMLNKAVSYLDQKLVEDYTKEIKGKGYAYLPLHYLYARSYITLKNNNPNYNKAFAHYIEKALTDWKEMDIYQQGQVALVLHRNGNNAAALKIIGLLKQTAQQSNEMGMYWANNRNGWWWYQSPIETQSLLIEAFDEVAADLSAVEEMKIWLLKNKQTNDWKTTKATTAACYALLNRGYDLLSETAAPEILIGNQTLKDLGFANNAKEAGTGYQKITIAGNNVKPEMGKVEIKNTNKTIAWGSLYWQYFEQLDKITPAETGVKIKKQLFLQKQSAKGDVLTPLTANNVPTPGDLLKVRVEIYSDRDMEYVHLKDMRSAGLEPVNVISKYKYQDGLGYYESTKDASTNFFISYLSKGTYVFEYALRVTHAGNFSNGISSLQCMYAPEFSTHSEGVRLTVKP